MCWEWSESESVEMPSSPRLLIQRARRGPRGSLLGSLRLEKRERWGTIKEDTQPPAPILRCRSRSALCPGQSPGSLAVRAETLLGLFDSAQRANVKRAAPARAVTIYLVADIPVVAFPGQLRDKPNGPGRRASAPKTLPGESEQVAVQGSAIRGGWSCARTWSGVRNPLARPKIDKTSAFLIIGAARMRWEGAWIHHHLLVY